MKKIVLIIVCMCLSHSLTFAQEEDIKREINNIKRDTTYIYGESTLANKDEAFEMAKDQLHINIELWVKSILPNQEITSVAAKKIDNYCQALSLMRGNLYRAFVYVNKDDIYALLPVNRVAIVSGNSAQLEMPSKKKVDIVNQLDGSKMGNKQNYAPQLSDPVTTKKFPDKDLLTELFKVSTLSDAKALLNSEYYKNRYFYGNVRSSRDGRFIKENNAMLLIFNHGDKCIRAIVKVENGSIINLRTDNSDNLANYPDCDAIWIVKSN